MKVTSFCSSNPTREQINKLIELKWLNDEDDWAFKDEQILKSLSVSFLGIDQRKLKSLLDVSHSNVVIVEERFAANNNLDDSKAIWIEDNLLVISTTNLSVSIPVIIQVGLYLLHWRLRNEISCSNKCILDTLPIDETSTICQSCENLLYQKGFGKDAIILKLLLNLKNKRQIEIEEILKLHVTESFRRLNLTSECLNFKIGAAEMIIDHRLKNGTELRSWIEKVSKDIICHKTKIKQKYKSKRNKFLKIPFFIASRRWNSWTPTLPRDNSINLHNIHKKDGGGYLISDGEINIVVDPGYGFLEMLRNFHDITVMDIDAIIITHDHIDHSSELQNILSLRFVYKNECSEKLKLYLNPSAYFLYRNILLYYSEVLHEDGPKLVSPQSQPFVINKMVINTITMYHNEVYHCLSDNIKKEVNDAVGESNALGLRIDISSEDGGLVKIAIPGDTSFPKELMEIERIVAFYENIDIASIHLGSLESKWSIKSSDPPSQIHYGDGKHLGINGSIKFLNFIRPKVAIISEFGEELDAIDSRLSIIELTKDLLLYTDAIIIPSDFRLFLALKDGLIFSKCSCGEFIPIEKTEFSTDKDDFINYSYKSGCKSKLSHRTFNN